MRFLLGMLRKLLPAPQRRRSPRGPDKDLENELTRYLGSCFAIGQPRIVHSEIGTVEVECGRVRLKAMREREFAYSPLRLSKMSQVKGSNPKRLRV